MRDFKVGDEYVLTHEPAWSSGSRQGKTVKVIDKGYYLAFDDGSGVTWPVNEYEVQ